MKRFIMQKMKYLLPALLCFSALVACDFIVMTKPVDDGGDSGKNPVVNRYTVSFNSNGGSFVAPINNVLEGTTVSRPSDPARDGFNFNGWYRDEALTNAWNFASDVVSANITLYARWTEIQGTVFYTVSFNSNGGSSVNPIQVAQNTTVNRPTDDPTKDGHIFDGWYRDEALTNAWIFASDVITANTTLFAKWRIDDRIEDNESGRIRMFGDIEAVFVKAGSFTTVGGTKITLTQGFYISKYPITQAQFQAKMGFNPSAPTIGNNLPVVGITWSHANTFAANVGGFLPTEAQWEFAARGGNKSNNYTYSGGNNLNSVGWYIDNSNSILQAVGQKSSNEIGIHDMSGNVWEWTADWYQSGYPSSQTDPTGASDGNERVFKGGSFMQGAEDSQISSRDGNIPASGFPMVGFRVAFSEN
ncbi:MAG: SUMF1/EgtB/PvdO family nonheme iron enzyme [Chitinivibrionia bacterium]|jgi:uncharacterized repeat protein (TIGR02543 family)|nr:SUMF1/EgtB/PvdO family nonheme iron enzyme [Chitinivibrionia bacterium]